jgi:hypothetical protein
MRRFDRSWRCIVERVVRVTGPIVDTSGVVTPKVAEALVAAGKLGVIRCIGLPDRSKKFDLSKAELAMLRASGLHVGLYAFWRAAGHSLAMGKQDAARILAMLEELGWPKDAPCFVDLEAHSFPAAADGLAYASAWSEALEGAGRPRAVYVDRSFIVHFTPADLRALWALFDVVWLSGSKPEPNPGPSRYACRQHAGQVIIAGLPFDLDDADDLLMLAAEGTRPVTSKYDFRAIVPGETEADRYCRMLEAILAAGQTPALLERGVSLSQSTCMIVARAAEWHARSLPAHGAALKRQTVTVNGLPRIVDYGDYGAEMQAGENFIDFGITCPAQALHAWCASGDNGWPEGPQRGACLYVYAPGVRNSEHVVSVIMVLERDGDVLRVETIEGGQYPTHVQRFKRSLVWDGRGWMLGAKRVKGWQVRYAVTAGLGAWPYPDSVAVEEAEVDVEAQPSEPPELAPVVVPVTEDERETLPDPEPAAEPPQAPVEDPSPAVVGPPVAPSGLRAGGAAVLAAAVAVGAVLAGLAAAWCGGR